MRCASNFFSGGFKMRTKSLAVLILLIVLNLKISIYGFKSKSESLKNNAK